MSRRKFEVLQRGIAQKQCGAYRTVSLNAAMLLTGMLPLDLRVVRWPHCMRPRRCENLLQLAGREVERRASALGAPHPAELMNIGFGILGDQEDLDNNKNYHTRIYTDGSRIDGRVGAALSVWQGDAETKAVKLALANYCTVYQAELLALREATGVALKSKEISFFWIKAHAGLDGNERADQLAKEAAVASKKRPNYDLCPVSHIKRILRKDSLDVWNRGYTRLRRYTFPPHEANASDSRKL
ncbi:uncharacterized protein [Choristoneura fumiferana]|uniref:uncharacterized protein n=1 Tax=Choristoneura fumiferana TaxID=7141 RepID=UPI003D154FE4